MSTNNSLSLSGKNGQMLAMIALLVGIVTGIVLWQLTDAGILVIAAAGFFVLGVYFLICVPFASDKSDFIPSQRSFRLVWGALLTAIGALLLVREYASVEWWIYVVVPLVVVIVVALLLFASNGGNKK